MEILVLNTKIETKDIVDIYEVERDKKMFLNREAGFIIEMIGGSRYTFSENIPYESYPSEISSIKSKWKKLREEVEAQWKQDKHDLKTFTL